MAPSFFFTLFLLLKFACIFFYAASAHPLRDNEIRGDVSPNYRMGIASWNTIFPRGDKTLLRYVYLHALMCAIGKHTSRKQQSGRDFYRSHLLFHLQLLTEMT